MKGLRRAQLGQTAFGRLTKPGIDGLSREFLEKTDCQLGIPEFLNTVRQYVSLRVFREISELLDKKVGCGGPL
jgi:hypothetical protein